MKLSMGFRGAGWLVTPGNGSRLGGKNDQCVWYSAPCSIQRFNNCFSTSVSFLFDSGGGMTLDLEEKMRRTNMLFSAFPGTMGIRPFSVRFKASDRISSRIPAWRSFVSGPWHLHKLLERMGRISA